jgi:hypothetical protein
VRDEAKVQPAQAIRETVVMDASPGERGTPEDDAARNHRRADRFWFAVADVDLRVQPVPTPRPFIANPARLRHGGFKR